MLNVSYEIPLPHPEKLQVKPILNAVDLHKYITEKLGVEPLSVSVDNSSGRIRVYFEGELGEVEKKKLYVIVNDYYRAHIGE